MLAPLVSVGSGADGERRIVAPQYRDNLAGNYARTRCNTAQRMFDTKRTNGELATAGNPTVEAASACYETASWSSAGVYTIANELRTAPWRCF